MSSVKPIPKDTVQRIGVFLPNWVGDACMATPTLRALRSGLPKATLVAVMRPVIRDLLSGAGSSRWIDEAVLFDERRSDTVVSRWGLVAKLRQASLDSLVLLPNSFWTAAVGRLAGIPRLVGYRRDARGWLLTDRLSVPRSKAGKPEPIPAVDYYLRLVSSLGISIGDRSMQLSVDAKEQAMGDAFWHKIGFQFQKPTLVINNNSATVVARIWPQEKAIQLARRVAMDWDWQVLLHCGPREKQAAQAIADAVGDRRVASMGMLNELPIGLSKAVIQRATVVVSSDSGPRHIAVSLGRPVVSLFGPTDAAWTRTYDSREIQVAVPIDCRPCNATSCPLEHHRCMHDISVSRVMEAIENHARSPRRSAA